MPHGLSAPVEISKTTCSRCGGDRVFERPCADCGTAPRAGETNNPVVRRRQACRTVDELVARNPGVIASHSTAPRDALVEFVEEFFSALAALINRPGDRTAAGIAQQLKWLEQITKEFERKPSLRPVATDRALLGACRELAKLWPTYREALTTTDIARVEELARLGQSLLDGSTAELGQVGLATEAASIVSDTTGRPALVSRLMEALAVRYPDKDLEQLAEIARTILEGRVPGEISTGSAVDFLVPHLIASSFLDPQAFISKVEESSRLLHSSSALQLIAQAPRAIEDLSAARRDVSEATNHFMSAISDESNEAAIVRRTAKVAGELYEAVAPLWAWLRMAVSGQVEQMDYAKIILKDTTDHIRAVSGLAPALADGAPAFLRHAAHHGRALTVDEGAETVAVTLRSGSKTLTTHEYLDQVFALVETVLALNWSLTNALEQTGIDIPLSKADANYIGVSTSDLAAFWLQHVEGVQVERSTVSEGVWTVEADLMPNRILPTAHALLQAADPGVARLVVQRTGSFERPVVIDAAVVEAHERAFADANDIEQVVLVAELTQRLARVGGPDLSRDHLESVTAAVAASVLAGELVNAPLLRRVRDLAIERNHKALANLAAGTLTAIRTEDQQPVLRDLTPYIDTIGLNRPINLDSIELVIDADHP